MVEHFVIVIVIGITWTGSKALHHATLGHTSWGLCCAIPHSEGVNKWTERARGHLPGHKILAPDGVSFQWGVCRVASQSQLPGGGQQSLAVAAQRMVPGWSSEAWSIAGKVVMSKLESWSWASICHSRSDAQGLWISPIHNSLSDVKFDAGFYQGSL